jgi:hypothetical protein
LNYCHLAPHSVNAPYPWLRRENTKKSESQHVKFLVGAEEVVVKFWLDGSDYFYDLCIFCH